MTGAGIVRCHWCDEPMAVVAADAPEASYPDDYFDGWACADCRAEGSPGKEQQWQDEGTDDD